MEVHIINTRNLLGIFSSYRKAQDSTLHLPRGNQRDKARFNIESINFDEPNIEYFYFIKYRSNKRFNSFFIHYDLDTLLEDISWTCGSIYKRNDLDMALTDTNLYKIKIDTPAYSYLELKPPIMRDGFLNYKMNDVDKIRKILLKYVDNDSLNIVFDYFDGYNLCI